MEHVVVPAFVGRAAHVPGRAVVGKDDAVGLHRLQDDLRLRGKSADVVIGFQAEARAKGWRVRATPRLRHVPRRPDVIIGGAVGGEAQGVLDDSRRHFFVSRQPGQNREAGRIGGGPAIGAEGVRVQIPDRAGASGPAAGGLRSIIKFVQCTIVSINYQDVMIRSPFAVGTVWDGIRPGVGFVRVVEIHSVFCCRRTRNDVVGNTDRASIPRA